MSIQLGHENGDRSKKACRRWKQNIGLI